MTRHADPDCWNCGGTGDDRPKGGGWHPDDSFPDCDCVEAVDEVDPDAFTIIPPHTFGGPDEGKDRLI